MRIAVQGKIAVALIVGHDDDHVEPPGAAGAVRRTAAWRGGGGNKLAPVMIQAYNITP